jgi:effector-binding domain-containing protein
VKCLKYFGNVIKNVKNKNPDIKNIIIVTGFHHLGNHTKSYQYIQKICEFFMENGYSVEKRINNDADEDFIFMSQSKYFVKSGGGFSNLIAALVKKNKGEVFDDTQIPDYYRLGDMIMHKNEREKGYKYHKKNFPNSIATKYMETTTKCNDLNVLCKIITTHINKKLKFPSQNTLVVHLRTGDVVDLNPQSVEEFLNSSVEHGNYVKCFKYYENIIKTIKEEKVAIHNVIIVSGFHIHGNHDKSLEYIQKMCDLFVENGYSVEQRINKDADEDFIFMAQSKYFVKSGGGFSKLIAALVKKNNGKVFEDE